jgi:hypothetical protein
MDEIRNRPFQLFFNASLKAGFHGSRVTSDGGLILVRELDERRGFGELIGQYPTDSRGKNTIRIPANENLKRDVAELPRRMEALPAPRGSRRAWSMNTAERRKRDRTVTEVSAARAEQSGFRSDCLPK